MPGRPYPSYPEADKASPEYAYVDPKTAFYDVAKLPREYHPLDAWNLLGRGDANLRLNRTFYPIIGSTIGFMSSILVNLGASAPLMTNIPRTLMAAAVCGALGEWTWHRSQAQAATRDAMIKHYLETHYDEFPTIKRYKFGEVFQPWRVAR